MSSLLVCDTETTGLDPATSGIVEIAFVVVTERGLGPVFSSLVWPGRHFLKQAHRMVLARTSRLTADELLDAPNVAEVFTRWRAWAREALGEPPYLVTSFNVEFDRDHLRNTPFDRLFTWQPCIMQRCSEVMGEAGALEPRYDRFGWRWPKLPAACAHFNVEFTECHRALEDAKAAARLVLALREIEQ